MQFYVYKNELSDLIRTVSKSYISDLLRFMISNNTYLLYYTFGRRNYLEEKFHNKLLLSISSILVSILSFHDNCH